jgi:hypothetical protein
MVVLIVLAHVSYIVPPKTTITPIVTRKMMELIQMEVEAAVKTNMMRMIRAIGQRESGFLNRIAMNSRAAK